MNAWIKKLTSRKFLLSVISMVAGIAALCGADETIVSILAGAAMTVLPAVVYCMTEGRIDEAQARAASNAVVDAADALGASQPVKDVLTAAGDILASLEEPPND